MELSKRKIHKGMWAFNRSIKRAEEMKTLPSWSDTEKIKEIYLYKPKGMNIDHVIPMKGELVSGLHVPENLQYLLPKEDKAKGNSFTPLIIINEQATIPKVTKWHSLKKINNNLRRTIDLLLTWMKLKQA